MAIIVQKFGGTSVGTPERIRHVAKRVKQEHDKGNDVAVVVSAMSGQTDHLVTLTKEISSLDTEASLREYDAIIASGEQVSAGLLALALQEAGMKARSFQGWQLPVFTNEAHSKARIEDVGADALRAAFKEGYIAVVTGFQGVTGQSRISTLGRGGSDTSAVALAAALDAERCDIYTDVDGVYTTDPRIAPKARKLQKIAYEEMLEMASLGAKVLQIRSVEMAMKHHVRLQVLSSFEELPGTLLTEEEEVMERRLITGITYSNQDARITLSGIPNVPGVAGKVFAPLAAEDVNVDMIVQNVNNESGFADITFTVPKSDFTKSIKILEASRSVLRFNDIQTRQDVSKISVVGVGMRSHAGLAQKMFETLADKNINIYVISTSEIKISVLIDQDYAELAVRTLHTAYGLDQDDTSEN